MFNDIQNGMLIQKSNNSSKRKGDMTVESNTYVDFVKPTANNSSILTPCSTDAIGSVENPEDIKEKKRNQKAFEKLNS